VKPTSSERVAALIQLDLVKNERERAKRSPFLHRSKSLILGLGFLVPIRALIDCQGMFNTVTHV
jgi:hypothetical protein